MSVRVPLRKKRSPIWTHFEQSDLHEAKCLYCSIRLKSTNGTTSNLSRHMQRLHPTIPIIVTRQNDTTDTAAATSADVELSTITCATSELPKRTQPVIEPVKITEYFLSKKPLNVRKSEELDRQLIKMIAKEYQPFSLVEDAEFKKFIYMLYPGYTLPTRKTVSSTLLPKYFNATSTIVAESVERADAVCITTDSWSSFNNDSFIAVTVHFIDENTKLQCYLLECINYTQSHTASNLAQFLSDVFYKWKIHDKVSAIVTDNAANVLAAVKAGNWRSIGCFAHKINLVLQDAIGTNQSQAEPNSFSQIVVKVKAIVQFYKQSHKAKAKLNEMQRNMGQPELKLKQDVPTRWNSTYIMLSRVLETKDCLISTLTLIRVDLSLTAHDCNVIELAVKILKIFYIVTEEVSGEQ